MTRTEIEAQYKISEHGMICDLGKFEGEMLYAPYFYELAMICGYDERIDDTDFFVLTDEEDKTQFPELHDAYGVTLVESEQGFVYCRAHGKAAYEMLLEQAQANEPTE